MTGEDEIRLLVETIPTPAWRAAPEGNVEYVNKRALEYFGAPAEEILGWGWMDKVHPDDIAFKERNWLRALQSQTPHDAVCRFQGADGQYRWFNVRGEPLRAGGGRVLCWYGVLIDIDDRTKAEEALRASEYKLRKIIETMPGFHWSTGPDGEPTQVNQRVLDYSGMQFGEFLQLGWERFLHPDDFPGTAKAFYDAIQTGTTYNAVHRLRRTDGEYRWHHATADPLRDESGRIIQWYGLSIDIDERKKAEDQLRRSEAYLAQAQRLSHTGSAAYNETEILYWSEEASRIWGFDPPHGIPSREAVWQRIHSDDLQKVNENIECGLREKRSFANEFRIVLPDGTIKHIEATNNPVFLASGELLEIVVTGVDVTDRKRAEQTSRDSEARFRDYAETASDWFWEIGPDYKFTVLTENAFGSHSADRIGIGCWDHALDLEAEPEKWRLVQATLDSREPFRDFVYCALGGHGSPMYVRVSGKPVFDAGGEFRGYRGTGTDVTEIMHTQEALRESERSSRSAIDGIAGLIAIMAPNGELDAINRQVIEYFGRSLEEMKNWGTSDAVHPEDLPRIGEIFQRSMATGTPFNYELRLRRFDGEYRWFDNRGAPIRESSGRIVRWYILGTDIEDRKRAEEALREREASFRDYAETASDWFWEIGPDYKFTLLTENAFGSHTADRIGTAWWDSALDLETEPEKWRFVRATLDSRKPFRDFVYCALGSDGSPMHVRASGKPMFGADGEFRGYRGTSTDVTAIMRAQEALRESERRSRSAIDGIAGLIAIMTPDGELETVNRQVIDYFGRPLEWLKNWGENDAVHPEDLPRILASFKRSLAAGTPFHYELRLRRGDGEYRWFDNRGVPVRDEPGRIARWYVLLVDIEDRTRALARLEQMQSDLAHTNRLSVMGELAASLAHEIAQPIATARNNAGAAMHFLEQSQPDLAEAKEALTCIVDDADRAGQILGRIRDQIKKAPLRKGRLDLNQAIADVVALAQGAIIRNRVSVQTHLTEGLPYVQADRVQIQQVVLNLVLNAIEAMSLAEKGVRELVIIAEPQKAGGVLVAVRDSGPGIDSKHLDRVFDAFYTTKSNGVGMGLSICRSIINSHGGRLWADVNEPRGAIFRFTLPSAED